MHAILYIANALPVDLARIGHNLNLSGTTHSAIGFGAWGIEPTTVVDFGDISNVGLVAFLHATFSSYPDEEAIYVTIGGKGQIVYRTSPFDALPIITLAPEK